MRGGVLQRAQESTEELRQDAEWCAYMKRKAELGMTSVFLCVRVVNFMLCGREKGLCH